MNYITTTIIIMIMIMINDNNNKQLLDEVFEIPRIIKAEESVNSRAEG